MTWQNWDGVRANCPRDGAVRLVSLDVISFWIQDDGDMAYTFTCPACANTIVGHLIRAIAETIVIERPDRVFDWPRELDEPHATAPIGPAEFAQFLADLGASPYLSYQADYR
jgi:hypothetical protein